MSDYGMVRYADEDEIVVPSGTKILDRIGTPEERKFLIAVMAEQLGIPASEATQPDVLAVIANAAQRTVQFGWQPGVHMHVQPFNETEEINGQKVKRKKWVLVDGEKAWKDSADRHRRNGVKFAIITRPQPMSKEEMAKEAQAQGMNPGDLAQNAYGVYAKVIVRDEFEIACMIYGEQEAFDSVPWAVGMYTGKKRSGRYWNEDNLPTGATAKDVAIRRAHKRALMQSTLPLIPLDDKSEKARFGEFTEHLRREELHRHRRLAMPAPRPALDAFEEEMCSGSATLPNDVIAEEAQRKTDGKAPNVSIVKTVGPNSIETLGERYEPEIEFEPSSNGTQPDDILIDSTVSERIFDYVERVRGVDVGRDASEKQHAFAVRLVDEVCGKGNHRAALAALLGRECSAQSPVTEGVFKEVLKTSHTTYVNGQPAKNEYYSSSDKDALLNVYRWAIGEHVAEGSGIPF